MIAIVIAFLQIIARLLADLVGLIALSVRPRRSIEAENLFLRRELALFKERRRKQYCLQSDGNCVCTRQFATMPNGLSFSFQ